MNFALVDQTFFGFVHEFDGVFNRQYVFVFVVVDVVDHGGKGGGFTGARRPGYQHQSTRHSADIAKHIAHAQFFHGQHFGRNGTEHRASAAVLVKGVNAKARYAGHFKRKVGFQKFFVVLTLAVIHNVVNKAVDLLVLHGR